MRVLVCGGRDFRDREYLTRMLNGLPFKTTIVIHGGARGADTLAGEWAAARGLHCAVVNALWDYAGANAGMLRNVAMLLLQPEYCVAFEGGHGTADMVELCLKNNIIVWDLRGDAAPKGGIVDMLNLTTQ
jgi:hypothetical protein